MNAELGRKLRICATLVVLAGCSSGAAPSSSLVASAAPHQSAAEFIGLSSPDARTMAMMAMTNAAHRVPRIHSNRGKSWMKPDTALHDLLYVSDQGSNTVDVYEANRAVPTLYGQLTGFDYPEGDCSDAAGNVYITSYSGSIVEYAHGGTTPIDSAQSGGNAIGCAYDPTTANIAVSNHNSNSGSGFVVVFSGGLSGFQIVYSSDLVSFWPPAYDSSGNLYVEGYTAGGITVSEAHAGSTSFKDLTLSGGAINFPGGVVFDGKYIVFSDQKFGGSQNTGFYRTTVSGTTATVVSSIVLTDTCFNSYTDIIQAALTMRKGSPNGIDGSNIYCSERDENNFEYFNYTTGGNPVKTIPQDIAPEEGIGQTFSLAAGQ
jgi:hypothetical protein